MPVLGPNHALLPDYIRASLNRSIRLAGRVRHLVMRPQVHECRQRVQSETCSHKESADRMQQPQRPGDQQCRQVDEAGHKTTEADRGRAQFQPDL